MKKDNNNKKDNQTIRKSRILRRKAKRFKKECLVLKFVLNKVIPFTVLRFFLKKIRFSWIGVGIFLLGLLFHFVNHISTKQFTNLREYEIELQQTKKEFNKWRSLMEQQQSLIPL